MMKFNAGFGVGLAALLAVCCGGHLLLLLALPFLAAVTGQVVLIALALAVVAAAFGLWVWQHKRSCALPPSLRIERTVERQHGR